MTTTTSTINFYRQGEINTLKDEIAKLRADNKALRDALLNLCDSLRKREGSNLIHVNHDELMEFIPAARKALAEHSEPQ